MTWETTGYKTVAAMYGAAVYSLVLPIAFCPREGARDYFSGSLFTDALTPTPPWMKAACKSLLVTSLFYWSVKPSFCVEIKALTACEPPLWCRGSCCFKADCKREPAPEFF